MTNSRRTEKDSVLVLRTLCFPSPLGWILIAASSEGICLLDFCGSAQPSDAEILRRVRKEYPGAAAEPSEDFPLLGQVKEALLEYLDHGTELPPFPLDTSKGTPFQREVWNALSRIPFGETRSYVEIAGSIGRPRAARAVGQACGKNPLAILIPCHRVVATGGKLGGYTGGLDFKEALLKLEQK